MAHIRQMERETITTSRDGSTLRTWYESLTTARLVDYVLGVVEVALGLRFLLKLFGANPNSGFASFVYDLTRPLVAPFHAVFGSTVEQSAVFEWSTLLAMVVYALLALAIVRLIEIATTSPEEERIVQ